MSVQYESTVHFLFVAAAAAAAKSFFFFRNEKVVVLLHYCVERGWYILYIYPNIDREEDWDC